MIIDLLSLSLAAAAATAFAPDVAPESEEPEEPTAFEGFSQPDPAAEPVPAPAPATDDGAGPPTWIAGAFVDTSYLLNSNFPGNHLYAGAVTHPRTGEFTLNVVAAQLRHEATEDEPLRFELALHAGAAVDALYAGEPVPGGAAGNFAGPEVWKHIALANAGYRFASGTEIDAGLQGAPIGVGGFWSKDNWTYSPALASNAVPYYLMGLRVAQDLPKGLRAEAWMVNGWQTIGDVNKAPSGLVGLHWAGGRTTAAAQVFFGPEQADLDPESWFVHVDTQVIWDGRPVGVAVVADAGREGRTAGGQDSYWIGGGVWVRGFLWETERSALVLAARPEAWGDPNGRIYGTPQTLLSGTIGPSLYLRDLLQVRLEYRYDRSLASDGFFLRGDSLALVDDQHTVMLNLLGKVEHAFARRRPQ
ncbi:MAG: outer membrane beta-barrel protein [Nannocystaceae bacterium]